MGVAKFTITNEMVNLITEITIKIGRLGLEKERSIYLRKRNRILSIHSSLAIENNILSIEQVTNIINDKRVIGPPQEIREVQNAYEAYDKAFKMNPYSVSDLLKAHGLLMIDLVKEAGAFRSGDVGIYDAKSNIVHAGARPQFIYKLVNDLFEWGLNDNTPDLIKSCVVHFELEMIHPFSDGNGRMGRLWQNLILSKWQNVFEWIPIETIVYENQQEYYKTLAVCNKQNDSSGFILFMLKVILKTLINIEIGKINLETSLEKLTSLEKEFFKKISPFLKKNKEISTKEAAALSKKSQATVRRYLTALVTLGLLKSVGQNKNRKYLLI